jgi:hypothetical protein
MLLRNDLDGLGNENDSDNENDDSDFHDFSFLVCFIQEQSVTHQFSNSVGAWCGRHALAVNGHPMGTAVLHVCRAIGIPCAYVYSFSDIQIDIGIGLGGQFSMVLHLLNMPGNDGPTTYDRSNQQLRRCPETKMSGDGCSR